MAHVAKVKMAGVSPMLGHYERRAERRGFRRENIDSERSHMNRAVGFESSDCEALARAVWTRVTAAAKAHENASGKALRKDANVMMDWVVTLPKDCPLDRAGDFFAAVVEFVQERYGSENVPGGFLHVDETTPHIHIPVVPELDGRLQASKVVNRQDLRTFHGDLGRHVDDALGMHVSIELGDEQKGEKQLSRLSHEEYKHAKEQLAVTEVKVELAERTLEELDDTITEMQGIAFEAAERADRARAEADAEESRLESVRRGLAAASERLRAVLSHKMAQGRPIPVQRLSDTGKRLWLALRNEFARRRQAMLPQSRAHERTEAGSSWLAFNVALRGWLAVHRHERSHGWQR